MGQTSRNLRHRVAEHIGVSYFTFKEIKAKVPSSIREHVGRYPGSTCSIENFKILAPGANEAELLVNKRLLIGRLNPVLNGNLGSVDLLLH